MQFTLNRPLNITLAQTTAPSIVMVGPETTYSAQVKVEGSKNEDVSFTIDSASQRVKLRNAGNKKLTIKGLQVNPSRSRFSDQGLVLVHLGGKIRMKANQAPGRYEGNAVMQARYTNDPSIQPTNYPVRLVVNILAKINVNVLRNLDFGQVISGASQNQVRVNPSSSDTRAGCISVDGEQNNNIKINYPAQVDMTHGANSLPVIVSSSIDSQGNTLRLNNQGNGQICFGGLLTVPAHTVPGQYRGRVDVQVFYP
ncbi:hypothetical protein BGC07_01510 [Piscirickettsia litoralis]|uniref:Uncharacterized protein n=1 Tax=Piscirickettsia litoralis TaxID=1891921 RepID=A0ABX3A537_9GAMM|nr:hypothetical protein BGC07_01510 [Piscirickettsia litoralis]